ncbi:MAG: rod shape-determining protein RodA [Acidimicrobiia bacterium]|nr:rod shape-determining protein RodA [Acidimicrobiia bacterium]MBP8179929.1 rod shape-determining protein RodA [Acidimicrobiia bacterium]
MLDRSAGRGLFGLDWVLTLAILVMAGLGMLMIYSATKQRLSMQGTDPGFYAKRQLLFTAIGFVGMLIAARLPSRVVKDMSVPAYIGVLVMLLAVLVIGQESKGAQAWFELGVFQLQPSEFMKIALALMLAWFLQKRIGHLDSRVLLVTVVISAVPIGAILLQPDLGTALILGVMMLTVLLVAGTQGRHLAIMTCVAVALVIVIIQSGQLADYQVDRLTVFLNADRDVGDAAYNLDQSMIAIGSGGFWGKGLFEGTQTKLSYVPEQHNDFVFTVVGEELGFAGAALVLAAYGLIVWRIWRVGQLASDTFGALLCAGIMGMFTFQVFQNVGMTMGIMPITGIPLPFLSYGGSSSLVSFVAIGLVHNVYRNRA